MLVQSHRVTHSTWRVADWPRRRGFRFAFVSSRSLVPLVNQIHSAGQQGSEGCLALFSRMTWEPVVALSGASRCPCLKCVHLLDLNNLICCACVCVRVRMVMCFCSLGWKDKADLYGQTASLPYHCSHDEFHGKLTLSVSSIFGVSSCVNGCEFEEFSTHLRLKYWVLRTYCYRKKTSYHHLNSSQMLWKH